MVQSVLSASRFAVIPALLLTCVIALQGQPSVETRDVATGLSVPVQILWGPDDHLWVVERAGIVSRIDPDNGDRSDLLELPDVFAPEERGVFGMAMHPDFSETPDLFLFYSYVRSHENGWDIWGKVVRYTYNADANVLENPHTIADSIEAVAWNLGGGILALPDETLLIGIGDGLDNPEDAQSHESGRGKILRVGLDGSVPEDNPWRGAGYPAERFWATGFRNPKGLAAGPNGIVYGSDWGTASLDEINIIAGDANYGWPGVLGICDRYPIGTEDQFCQDSGVVEPIYEWYKAERIEVRPADLRYSRNSVVEHWKGSLLVATLENGFHQLMLNDEGDSVEFDAPYLVPGVDPRSPGRLRTVCISPDGRIFIGTSNTDGDATEPFPGPQDDRVIEILDADEIDRGTELKVRTVATDLTIPWEIQWGTDNRIWFTERPGRVRRVDPETGEVRTLLTVPQVFHQGASKPGLLGLEMHPNFCDTPQVFLVYNYLPEGTQSLIYERLVRYTYDEVGDTLLDERILIDSIEASHDHAGSRLVIAPDRTIFMTTGDADKSDLTQNLSELHGKILRVNLDGSAPPDNPWADLPYPGNIIWSIGHRNPQGLVLSPDGILYSSEHGPWSDDEVNVILPGHNYGWPDVLGFCDTPAEEAFCTDSAITEPIIAWSPTIAPGGLDFYAHDAIPEWEGSLLLSVMKDQRLLQLRLTDDMLNVDSVNAFFPFEFGRIRDVCIAPDGRVFFTITNRDGLAPPAEEDDRIMEISNAAGHPPLPEPGELCDRVPLSVQGPVNIAHSTARVIPQPIVESGIVHIGMELGSGTVKTFGRAGELLRTEMFSGGNRFRFDRGALEHGFYLVEIADGRSTVQLKLLVH